MDMSEDSKKNFFKYVFNFDDDSKGDILNLLQYTILAIIPIVVMNKVMGKYVPDVDETKGSLEIIAEVLIQIIGMFLGLFLINRVIIFIPTYSEKEYPETFSIHFIVLAVLMITLSLQTKLGEKVNLLVDRVNELWNGKDEKKTKGKNSNVRVSQPISGQQIQQMTNQNYSDGTSINSLPQMDMSAAAVTQTSLAPQSAPNFDKMFRSDTTPLVDAALPGQMEGFSSEPAAANSVLGGGAFSSW